MKNFSGKSLQNITKQNIMGDIIPNQGGHIDTNKFHWDCIYNLMDNVKGVMNQIQSSKKTSISKRDVQEIINYINSSIQNLTH